MTLVDVVRGENKNFYWNINYRDKELRRKFDMDFGLNINIRTFPNKEIALHIFFWQYALFARIGKKYLAKN